MKLLLVIGLVLALSPRACKEENDEIIENGSPDAVGYVAEDIKAREAIAEWKKFMKESDSAIYAARVQISRAADRLDDPDMHQMLKFRNHILKADGQLEQLSEKLLRGERFNLEDYKYDEEIFARMKEFEEDFRRKQQHLNETLNELRSEEYYKKKAGQ